jgi:lipoprotein-releasing system ATP-binding protein
MSETPVLSLRDLRRSYPSGDRTLDVLKGADLDLFPGEIVGLIGPSGSGKSSLLHAAGLLERPTGGSVVIEGVEASKLTEKVRTRIRLRSIGFVYQFHHLLPEFTALDNVALPQMILGRTRRQAQARAGNCWAGSAWPSAWTISPRNFRAASSSGSPSPAPWRTIRA